MYTHPENCDSLSFGSIPCCKTKVKSLSFPARALLNITHFGFLSSSLTIDVELWCLSTLEAPVPIAVVVLSCLIIVVCLFLLFIRYYDAQLMVEVPRAICSKPYLQVKLELSIRPVLSWGGNFHSLQPFFSRIFAICGSLVFQTDISSLKISQRISKPVTAQWWCSSKHLQSFRTLTQN